MHAANLLFALLALTSQPLHALPPQAYHKALRQRYPQASNITWQSQDDDYVATFQLNDFLTHAWLDANGNWLLTDTDLLTTDQLPPVVYNYFTLSPYADWNVTDVHRIELAPQQPSATIDPVRYVLTTSYDNSSETYQLFYTPDGILLRTRDISYLPTTLTPNDFR